MTNEIDLLQKFYDSVEHNPLDFESINKCFAILLENHQKHNIYFPGCSVEVFAKNLPAPKKDHIAGPLKNTLPYLKLEEMNSFHGKFGPYLIWTHNEILKLYKKEKLIYLDSLYDFKILNDDYFICFNYDTKDKLDYLMANFYDRKKESLTISMIYWELEQDIDTQTRYLNYVKNKYGISLSKVLPEKKMDAESKSKYIPLKNKLKLCLQNYKKHNSF